MSTPPCMSEARYMQNPAGAAAEPAIWATAPGAVAGNWALAAGAAAFLALASAAEGLLPEEEAAPPAFLQTVYEPAGQYHLRLDASGRYQVQVRGLRSRPLTALAQVGG